MEYQNYQEAIWPILLSGFMLGALMSAMFASTIFTIEKERLYEVIGEQMTKIEELEKQVRK